MGGKRWLATGWGHLFPTQFARYIEPFLGGGAVFFHLRPKDAILSDRNVGLVNVYKAIRSDWTKVDRALRRHQRSHCKEYYYLERRRTRRVPHEQAAQLLYLNRTCWNGLYRVNLKGVFNVPIGTKTTVLLGTDDFERTASLLRNVEFFVSDFEPILDMAKNGDFVFVDPPYVTHHNFNGFRKYNEMLFTWDDQIRLAAAVKRAAERGAMVLLMNADHPSVRSLYSDLGPAAHLRSLTRSSVLAASAEQRGAITELAVAINYEP